MTKLASAMVVVVGVSLSVFGLGAGDAAAQPTGLFGPGNGGILQGAICRAELDTATGNVSYYAGNGGLAVSTATTWVTCPVNNVSGLIASPTGAFVYIKNVGTATSSCFLRRMSYSSGANLASSSVVVPGNMTSVQSFSIPKPTLTGGYYSLECNLAPGASFMGYYINMAD